MSIENNGESGYQPSNQENSFIHRNVRTILFLTSAACFMGDAGLLKVAIDMNNELGAIIAGGGVLFSGGTFAYSLDILQPHPSSSDSKPEPKSSGPIYVKRPDDRYSGMGRLGGTNPHEHEDPRTGKEDYYD